MPYVFSAATSTDAGNVAKIGSDGGVYVPPAYPPMAGLNPAYTLDNSWAGSGQAFAYALPGPTTSSLQLPAAAFVYPIMVARTCTLTGLQLYVNTAGAASSFIRHSMYAADAVTGAAGAKITDLAFGLTTSSGAALTMTFNSATPMTLVARTLYWCATWGQVPTGALPTVTMYSASGWFPTRYPGNVSLVASNFTATSGFNRAYLDTSMSWSTTTVGPATLSPTYGLSGGTANYHPLFQWQLTNV